MIRRAVLVTVAAATLILAPTAAMAYNAPGYSSTVSDSTPAIGSGTEVVISGADANAAVTLTITSTPTSISSASIEIAGTKSHTNMATASGVATFMVTLNAGGSYALVATDAAGSVLSTQTLTVDGADGLTPGGDPADGTGADGDAADDELANTGLKSVNLAVGGGVLVLVGAGAVLVTRRRKSAQVPA